MPTGDESPFASHYELAAPALCAWAALRCRGPLGTLLDADDLVQEVALEAMRAFERFDPEHGSFRPWLFGVATRVSASLLRSSARRHGIAAIDPLGSQDLRAEVTTISRRVRRDEALTRLLEQVAKLEPIERDLLLYRGLAGLDHAEVAELVGLGTEAATKRWLRLRGRLVELPAARDLLGEH
ncbi:MAG: sigma-70 family RNA polymerase sigma factor [Planctomycetota bacterium]|nr:sigma-70 family RNA polymerase sigma factor [Planctomycetota bacterium]